MFAIATAQTNQTEKILSGSRSSLFVCALFSVLAVAATGCSSQDSTSESSTAAGPETSSVAAIAAQVKAAESAMSAPKSYSARQVDILWVVDTSGNMSQAQKMIADQSPALIDALSQIGIDYQMAVTSMDTSSSGEQGRFLLTDGPAILSGGGNAASILQTRLYPGDYDWHPATHALEAVKLALTEPNSTSGANAGFVRPGSLLVMIFVSASNDQSVPLDYKGWLDQLKPKSATGEQGWMANFVGILPLGAAASNAASPGNVCKSASAQPGVVYQDLVTASNGVSKSICASDFSTTIASIKDRLVDVATSYSLGNADVDTSSLTVMINGKNVLSDLSNGWTFDKASNSIHFHGSAMPAANANVAVHFSLGHT